MTCSADDEDDGGAAEAKTGAPGWSRPGGVIPADGERLRPVARESLPRPPRPLDLALGFGWALPRWPGILSKAALRLKFGATTSRRTATTQDFRRLEARALGSATARTGSGPAPRWWSGFAFEGVLWPGSFGRRCLPGKQPAGTQEQGHRARGSPASRRCGGGSSAKASRWSQ